MRASAHLARLQLDRIVDETSDVVQARVDRNHDAARRIAKLYRDFAADQIPFLLGVNYESFVDSTYFPTVRQCILGISRLAESYGQGFRTFVAEHEILLEADVRTKNEDFLEWARKQPEAIAPFWKLFVAHVQESLVADAKEHEELAAEWSDTDGDGWGAAGHQGD